KICLQLEPDRKLVVIRFAEPTTRRLHTITDAEQILHVMSNFMCNNVCLREIATGTQPLLEFVKKSEVDVNTSIFWTIKRTGGTTGKPAAGPSLVCEEYELRLFVFASHLLEDRMPCVFGIGENDSDELRCLIARCLAVDLRRLR